MSKTYTGRLVTLGDGHIRAYDAKSVGEKTVVVHDADGDVLLNEAGGEVTITTTVWKAGKDHLRPLKFNKADGTYTFCEEDDKSHNDLHGKTPLDLVATQDADPDQPGYAGTESKPAKGLEHHFGVQPDDPHYSEGATDDAGNVTHKKLGSVPDQKAAKLTGHTDSDRKAAE